MVYKENEIAHCNLPVSGDDPTRERRIPGLIPADHPRRKEAMRIMLGHALDIAKGLEYIHGKGYTHRDMKLENVLVGKKRNMSKTNVLFLNSKYLLALLQVVWQ